MKQRELARQLGLSESAVSKLAKAGMPTHSVEAAAAWRRSRVAPYIKSQPPAAPSAPARPAQPMPLSQDVTGPDIDTAAELRAFAVDTPDPVDFIDALARNTAILAADDLLTVLGALGEALHAALRTAGDAKALEPALQLLMRRVPERLRDRVVLDMAVWDHLLREYLKVHVPDAAGAAAASDAEAGAAGRHVYRIACGEWVLR